jgi:hypothetical protein
MKINKIIVMIIFCVFGFTGNMICMGKDVISRLMEEHSKNYEKITQEYVDAKKESNEIQKTIEDKLEEIQNGMVKDKAQSFIGKKEGEKKYTKGSLKYLMQTFKDGFIEAVEQGIDKLLKEKDNNFIEINKPILIQIIRPKMLIVYYKKILEPLLNVELIMIKNFKKVSDLTLPKHVNKIFEEDLSNKIGIKVSIPMVEGEIKEEKVEEAPQVEDVPEEETKIEEEEVKEEEIEEEEEEEEEIEE